MLVEKFYCFFFFGMLNENLLGRKLLFYLQQIVVPSFYDNEVLQLMDHNKTGTKSQVHSLYLQRKMKF